MQLKRDGIVTLDQENLGSFANRLNNRIRDLKGRSIADAWSGEIRELLERVISPHSPYRTLRLLA